MQYILSVANVRVYSTWALLRCVSEIAVAKTNGGGRGSFVCYMNQGERFQISSSIRVHRLGTR